MSTGEVPVPKPQTGDGLASRPCDTTTNWNGPGLVGGANELGKLHVSWVLDSHATLAQVPLGYARLTGAMTILSMSSALDPNPTPFSTMSAKLKAGADEGQSELTFMEAGGATVVKRYALRADVAEARCTVNCTR